MRSAFPGFPREAIQFFRGLARNNNRDWFLPRKTIFEEQVKQPMRELVAELNGAMMGVAPEYGTDRHAAPGVTPDCGGTRGTGIVRRVARGAAFTGAERLLRGSSRGGPAAVQATHSVC